MTWGVVGRRKREKDLEERAEEEDVGYDRS